MTKAILYICAGWILACCLRCIHQPNQYPIVIYSPITIEAVIDSTTDYILRRIKNIPTDKRGSANIKNLICTLKQMVENDKMLRDVKYLDSVNNSITFDPLKFKTSSLSK